jgi:hypothetical protein
MDGWQHDYGKTTSINYFELQVIVPSAKFGSLLYQW